MFRRAATPLALLFALAAGAAFAGDRGARLTGTNDWLYALQHPAGVRPADIAATDFDIVVMDYAADGDEATEFQRAEIESIQATGKIVLAYMSIGEAEEQRFYWNPAWSDQPAPDPDAPAWLGPFNPDFPDNYKVRYWLPEWRPIIFGVESGPNKSYLDRIVDQGFDGVYLDIVDGFEYWSDDNPERTREQARADMIDFVLAIADHARTTRGLPQFLVFPQNATSIIGNDEEEVDALGESYLAAVDGIGAEDTFYDALSAQPPSEWQYSTMFLDRFRSEPGATRRVLAVDYVWRMAAPTSQANIDRYNDFQSRCLERGYTPYAAVSNRDLNEILPVAAEGGFLYPQPKPDAAAGDGLVAR